MNKLIVFDLDFTLWDAGGTWCDHTNPPYKRVGKNVVDSSGANIQLYPDVPDILDVLQSQKVEMALASRTGEPSWARSLLSLFEITHFFDYQEIYPGSKLTHFSRLQEKSGKPYDQMVFFDDEMRNVREVATLGVEAIYVADGLNKSLVRTVLGWR